MAALSRPRCWLFSNTARQQLRPRRLRRVAPWHNVPPPPGTCPLPPPRRRKADEEIKERAQKAKAELVGKQQASLANAAVAATLGGKAKGKLNKWDKWAAAGPAAGGGEDGDGGAAGGKGKKGGGGKKGGKKGAAAAADAGGGGSTTEGEAAGSDADKAKVRPGMACPSSLLLRTDCVHHGGPATRLQLDGSCCLRCMARQPHAGAVALAAPLHHHHRQRAIVPSRHPAGPGCIGGGGTRAGAHGCRHLRPGQRRRQHGAPAGCAGGPGARPHVLPLAHAVPPAPHTTLRGSARGSRAVAQACLTTTVCLCGLPSVTTATCGGHMLRKDSWRQAALHQV